MTSAGDGVWGEKTPRCSVVLIRFRNKTVKCTHNTLVMARVLPKKLSLPLVRAKRVRCSHQYNSSLSTTANR